MPFYVSKNLGNARAQVITQLCHWFLTEKKIQAKVENNTEVTIIRFSAGVASTSTICYLLYAGWSNIKFQSPNIFPRNCKFQFLVFFNKYFIIVVLMRKQTYLPNVNHCALSFWPKGYHEPCIYYVTLYLHYLILFLLLEIQL